MPLNLFRKAKREIIRLITPSVVEDIEKLELSKIADGNGKCWQKNCLAVPFKNIHTSHSTPRFPKIN